MHSLSLALLVVHAAGPLPGDAEALAALDEMFAAWAEVQTLTFRQTKTERFRDGSTTVDEQLVKLRRGGEFYLKNLRPRPGQEAIYSARRDLHKLIGHRGSFPDVTVTLSIWSSLATAKQHHPITHLGFGYLFEQIEAGMQRARRKPNGERVEWGGALTLRGTPAVRLVLHAGDAAPKPVVAPEKESVVAFGRRVGCDPFWIVYLNDGLEGLSDKVSAGTSYLVPGAYGQKTELVLAQANHLPLRVTIWDFAGNIYERFEYFDLVVNPPLTDLDFDPENPAYGF